MLYEHVQEFILKSRVLQLRRDVPAYHYNVIIFSECYPQVGIKCFLKVMHNQKMNKTALPFTRYSKRKNKSFIIIFSPHYILFRDYNIEWVNILGFNNQRQIQT